METTRVEVRELVDAELLPLHDAGMTEGVGDPGGAVPPALALDDEGEDLGEEHAGPVVAVTGGLGDEVLEGMELLGGDSELEVVPVVGWDVGTNASSNPCEEERGDGDPGLTVIEHYLGVGVWALGPPANEAVVPFLLVSLEECDSNLVSPAH